MPEICFEVWAHPPRGDGKIVVEMYLDGRWSGHHRFTPEKWPAVHEHWASLGYNMDHAPLFDQQPPVDELTQDAPAFEFDQRVGEAA